MPAAGTASGGAMQFTPYVRRMQFGVFAAAVLSQAAALHTALALHATAHSTGVGKVWLPLGMSMAVVAPGAAAAAASVGV